MMKSNIILVFLVFVCMNTFSQSETGRELDSIIHQTQLEAKELKSQVDLLRSHVVKIKDSLRNCLNPSDKNHSERDSEPLLKTGKYYALIIAVSDYENDRTFTDLPEAVNDGKELKEVLEENYFFERVQLLINPKKIAIMMQLSGLIEEVNNNDNVLIFYAGHGYMWKDKKRKGGYWCPADAQWQINHTLINDYEILKNLEYIESKNMLLISDACHASSITNTRSVNPPQSLINQEMHDKPSAFYISSGSDSQVPDDSKFFRHLIAGLKENTERNLSATDLFYKYLKPYQTSTLLNGQIVIPQMSQLDWHELGGDFFFIRK